MKLHTLKPAEGSRQSRKRVGRGNGSGWGKTAGSGHKGQLARSGGKVRATFEGGQTPLNQRLPKFGFKNPTRKEVAVVNLSTLNRFEDGTEVTPELLKEVGIIKNHHGEIKVLGEGNLERKLNVKAHRFSKSAQEAIAAAGGSVEVI